MAVRVCVCVCVRDGERERERGREEERRITARQTDIIERTTKNEYIS